MKRRFDLTKAPAASAPEKPHPLRNTGGYNRRNSRWDSVIGRWVTGMTVSEYMRLANEPV